jgi:hypothetical protein
MTYWIRVEGHGVGLLGSSDRKPLQYRSLVEDIYFFLNVVHVFKENIMLENLKIVRTLIKLKDV